jgi:hypothetical protein
MSNEQNGPFGDDKSSIGSSVTEENKAKVTDSIIDSLSMTMEVEEEIDLDENGKPLVFTF